MNLILFTAGVLVMFKTALSDEMLSSTVTSDDTSLTDESTSTKSDSRDIIKPRHFVYSRAEKCEIDEVCVRFCCTNKTLCLEDSYFDLGMVKEAENLSLEYKVLEGIPDCNVHGMYHEEDSYWGFSQV